MFRTIFWLHYPNNTPKPWRTHRSCYSVKFIPVLHFSLPKECYVNLRYVNFVIICILSVAAYIYSHWLLCPLPLVRGLWWIYQVLQQWDEIRQGNVLDLNLIWIYNQYFSRMCWTDWLFWIIVTFSQRFDSEHTGSITALKHSLGATFTSSKDSTVKVCTFGNFQTSFTSHNSVFDDCFKDLLVSFTKQYYIIIYVV